MENVEPFFPLQAAKERKIAKRETDAAPKGGGGMQKAGGLWRMDSFQVTAVRQNGNGMSAGDQGVGEGKDVGFCTTGGESVDEE